MDAGIKKIIELVKRTGDRFVVLDTESNEPFVVMTFDEYENLMGGGECLCESCQDDELENEDAVEEEMEKEIWGAPETETETEKEFSENEPTESTENIQPVLEKKSEENADEKYYFEPVVG